MSRFPDQPLRILFGTHLHGWGGGERWMLNAALAMSERGHRVTVCAPGEAELRRRAARQGLATLAVEFRRDFDPVSFLRVWRLCRRQQIEIFCLNMDRVLRVGGLAARLAGVPVVIPRRGSEFSLKGHLNYRLQYQAVATALIVNSQATARTLLQGISWRPRGRIHVLYNGLDLRPFRNALPRDAVRRSLGFETHDVLLICVGELTERKNHALLISILPDLIAIEPRIHVLLVGRGPQADALREQSEALAVAAHVHLLGFRDDVPDLLAASDVLVHPARVEGFGYAVAEAMAAGLPTVASNASSLPEIVEHGHSGWLFPPDDSDALREGLTAYLRDPNLRAQHGEAGRSLVSERFEISERMGELERIFRQELGERRRR